MEQVCDLCNGRGYIIDDNKKSKKCVCSVKKELQAVLHPLLQYKLNKHLDINILTKDLTLIDSESDYFYSFVKSYLFKVFFNEKTSLTRAAYHCGTGYSLVEAYLNNTISTLYTLPYLFIDLTQYCNNKAMGETILYTLQQRQFNSVISWTYIGQLTVKDITEIYHPDLAKHLVSQKTISLLQYAKDLQQ